MSTPSPKTSTHAKISRNLLNKLKQALSKPKPTLPTATTDMLSHNDQEHRDTADSFSWFRMDVESAVQMSTPPTPSAGQAESIATIVTQTTNNGAPLEGTVPWVSPLTGDKSYEQWVEEERFKAAMKRQSMIDLYRVSNGMTVFNARPASSLVPLYQPSVEGEDLQERSAAATTEEHGIHAVSTAYSIQEDALTFPATRLLDYDQESIKLSPAKPTPRASPGTMAASQVNATLWSSLSHMQSIKDRETIRRHPFNTISRHIHSVNCSAYPGDEPCTESRDIAIAGAEAVLTAGPSGGFHPGDCIDGVPRWFAENICALTEPSSPLGHFSVLDFPHETTTADGSEIRIHPTPEVLVLQTAAQRYYSTAGIIGDSSGPVRGNPLGWITTEEMVPVLIPKPLPRPKTLLRRLWRWLFGGLMKFSENVVVVPTLQWDFQGEKWVHVRGGRAECKA